MTWRGLSHVVAGMRPLATGLPAGTEPRLAATLLATRYLGGDYEAVLDCPSWVNVGALALAMRDRLVVHELRAPVPRVVAETDLHALPDEPPVLLRSAVIVEVRTPGPESLLTHGDTATCSLGCYELDGVRYLVGCEYPDGIRVARWTPAWPGGDLDEGVAPERDPSLLEGLSAQEHAEWGRAAARLLVVLGLLLDASGTPLRTRDEGARPAGRSHGESRPARPWAVRRVYLDQAEIERRGGGGGGAGVEVRGHLKRQRHGPGGAERRWIYVESYGARRWVSPQARVVVGVRQSTS